MKRRKKKMELMTLGENLQIFGTVMFKMSIIWGSSAIFLIALGTLFRLIAAKQFEVVINKILSLIV